MPEFKAAVKEVEDDRWHDLHDGTSRRHSSSTPRCAT